MTDTEQRHAVHVQQLERLVRGAKAEYHGVIAAKVQHKLITYSTDEYEQGRFELGYKQGLELLR